MNNMTLAAWVKADASASAGLAWLINGSGADGVGFAYQNPGLLVKILIGGVNYVTTGYTLTVGLWTHMAAVRVAAGGWQIWANGVLIHTSNVTAPVAPTVGFQIGNGGPLKLAECGLWDVPLSPDQVGALAVGAHPLKVAPANLRRYLPLWGVAFPEAELSGAAANGVLTGAAALADHPPMGPILIAA